MTDKPNCERHKKEVCGVSDMKVLAEAIGDLHYATLSDLMFELFKKIEADGMRDLEAKRLALADNLLNASRGIYLAHHHILAAWRISKTFMNDKPPTNGR